MSTKVKSKHQTANINNTLLSASFLQRNDFKLIEESESPFENFKMGYFVKEGIVLFHNTPVTELNENDFLIGYAETRCGKHYVVAFRWIKEQKDLIEIFKTVKGKELDIVS